MYKLVFQMFCPATLVAALLLTMASPSAGTIITLGPDSSWPGAPVVEAAYPHPSVSTDSADTADGSLAQSCQLRDTAGAGIDARTLYIRYKTNDAMVGSDMDVDLSIYALTDVTASSHTEPPTGTPLFSETVTFPEVNTSTTGKRIAHIVLNAPLHLPESSGVEGYLFHLTNFSEVVGGKSNLSWYRTGSTLGSVYTYGLAYEDGAWKNSGLRDWTLAISEEVDHYWVPEPSSLVLASFLPLFALACRRNRKSRFAV